MKNLYLCLGILFLVPYPASHLSGQCQGGSAQINLDINNISARLRIGGDLWWDGSDSQYIAPKDSNPPTTSLFSGSLWIGGIDQGGALHLAAQTYGSSQGANEYWPGPLDPITGEVTVAECANWDRFFEVTSQEILALRQDFEDNGMLDEVPPENILGWPGIGNPYFFDIHSFDLPASNQMLAPFWDQDEDGSYDPYQGDYPLVKGDQAIWWVMNDNGSIHGNSQGNPLKVEIHATAFAYQSDDDYINNTTFYEYTIIYRNSEPLDSTYLSLWVDPDLGCWSDDFIGCDVDAMMGFVYNADDFDEDCQGLNGYQSEIPVLGIKVLTPFSSGSDELPFSSFTYYLNPSDGNPPQNLIDPDVASQFYGYMTGSLLDGTPFSQGGNGSNPGEPPYPYVFDGSTFMGEPWTECSAGSDPSDRRFLMNFGPTNMQSGAVYKFAFSVLWKPDQAYPCPSFDPIVQDGDLVQQFYDQKCQELMQGGVTQTVEKKDDFQFEIIPNPMDQSAIIKFQDTSGPIQMVRILSVEGKVVGQWVQIQHDHLVIERADLPSGVYWIQVLLEDGTLGVQKLLIL